MKLRLDSKNPSHSNNFLEEKEILRSSIITAYRSSNILHIDVEKSGRDIHVKVVNLLGSVVVEHTVLKEQQNTINISGLNTGIYLAVIETGGTRYYYKFVKQ